MSKARVRCFKCSVGCFHDPVKSGWSNDSGKWVCKMCNGVVELKIQPRKAIELLRHPPSLSIRCFLCNASTSAFEPEKRHWRSWRTFNGDTAWLCDECDRFDRKTC